MTFSAILLVPLFALVAMAIRVDPKQEQHQYTLPRRVVDRETALRLASDGDQYKGFLLNNVLPQSRMPLSYAVVPPYYFEVVPENERPHHYNTSYIVPQCGGDEVNATQMNKYMFETERWLSTLGLNIFDAAMWCVATSLLGETFPCQNYTTNVLVGHKTVQFLDIRGDAPCKGVMEWGQCTDPTASGVCGFCYGDGTDKSLQTPNSYFFRMISDYWAIQGTIDDRCPERKQLWIWNDYKPILGENAWANYLGPIHNAMMRNGNDPTKIASDDAAFVLGVGLLTGLQAMQIGTTGGVYFCPRNTWFGFSQTAQNIGSTFSIENQGSLYAGLRAFHALLLASGQHKSHVSTVATLVTNLRKFILSAYDPSLGFFRQGGTYDPKTDTITWGQNNEPIFAVDCQTWVSSVLGTQLLDGTFGNGTAYNLWLTVKKRAAFECPAGGLCGVGYTDNSYAGPVFSGEWTYGAINWLRVMIADSGYNESVIKELQKDIDDMNYGLISYLVTSSQIHNGTVYYDSVKYAERRYWIPFGWYANPLPATASTAWAVAVAKNFNPFNLYGNYSTVDAWTKP